MLYLYDNNLSSDGRMPKIDFVLRESIEVYCRYGCIADRTQVGPMLAPRAFLSGYVSVWHNFLPILPDFKKLLFLRLPFVSTISIHQLRKCVRLIEPKFLILLNDRILNTNPSVLRSAMYPQYTSVGKRSHKCWLWRLLKSILPLASWKYFDFVD